MARSLAVLTLVLLLLLPVAAKASTIVFVRDHNVWITDVTSGLGYQVTADGTAANPYYSPSQSDSGIIVAARDKGNGEGTFVRLDQAGNVLAEFEPVTASVGPLEPQISPDGTVAGFHVASSSSPCYMSSCPGGSTTAHYTFSDRNEPASQSPGGFGDVSWMSNTQTIVFSNGAWIHEVGTDNVYSWIDNVPSGDTSDPMTGRNMEDGEVSADGKRVAVVLSHYEDDKGFLQFYKADQPPPTAPTAVCRIFGPNESYVNMDDPTWSPDGARIAWGEEGVVYNAAIDLDTCAVTDQKAMPGAEPHWSPAPYDPPAVDPGPNPAPPDPTPEPDPCCPDDDTTAPVLSKLKVKARAIAFSLSEIAAVRFTFERKRPGGGWRKLKGKIETLADAGPNKLAWNGKVGRTKLRRGTYRVTALPLDLAANYGKPVRKKFKKR